MPKRLVVIGGGAAGMSAASAARRNDAELEIVVVEATGYAAWGLCGLPYYLAGLVDRASELVSYPPRFFREQRGIDLRLHTRATEFDVLRKTVVLEHEGQSARLPYSSLVVTAGATAVRPPIPGTDDERVFTLRTLEEAARLRQLLDAGRIGRVLVVGAGYVGLEIADAFVARGCEVTVVEQLLRVLPNLDEEFAHLVEADLRDHVDLRLGARLVGLAPGPDGIEIAIDKGVIAAVDAVVLAVGVRPASGIATAAGATTTDGGALLVDDRQRTSLPDVYAAGDCVAAYHQVLRRPIHIALAPAANRMGRVAGTVASGGEAIFPGIVGTAIVKVFDQHVARTGLTGEEASAAGIEARATDVVHRSRAKYYPGSQPVHIRLVHTSDGRLLGGQIVSRDAAAVKRIDVIATALYAGLDVSQLGDLDLAYAPPYSPVYDPLVIAAQAAQRDQRRMQPVRSAS